MIIRYDPATGAILQTAEVSDVEAYRKMLTGMGESFIETEAFGLDLDIRHILVKDGELVLMQSMSITPPAGLKVGVESALTGVPAGAQIVINGDVLGTMDESGALDFTPQNAGTYAFQFSLPGWITTEISLEALP